MTAHLGGTGSSAHDEVLAGEYVLGALSPDTARQVEARLKTDRHFAAIVKRWRENLKDADEETPDPWLMLHNDRATGAPLAPTFSMPRRKLWQSFAFWRGFGVAALGLIALYSIMETRDTLRTGTAEPQANMLRPVYDPVNGHLAIDATQGVDQHLKVWLIENATSARLLGDMPLNGTMMLDKEIRQKLSSGATIALAPAN